MADPKSSQSVESDSSPADNSAPAGIDSPGTFVPLSQVPHSAEDSLPSRGGSSGKD